MSKKSKGTKAVTKKSSRLHVESIARAGEMGAVSQGTYSQSSVRSCGGQDGSFARMGSDYANNRY